MSTTLDRFHEIVNGLVAQNVPRDKATAAARKETGVPLFDASEPVERDTRSEKEIEAEGDRLMQKLGFEVIRFSHPGKTKQTLGIPDRRYYRRPRTAERKDWRGERDGTYTAPAITLWMEYKSATGEQRPGQKLFQELVESCGENYLCGGIEELTDWLAARNIIPF